MELHIRKKYYGSKLILQQVKLSLETGKVYGVVGENGAGKTTLFRCMAGLEKFDGTRIPESAFDRRHIGFLETDPYFLTRITGREYLQLLCNARDVSLQHIEEKNIFNLPLDEFAEHYSTGMKKKLALMGVLLQNNSLFILDEPFNGVDIQSNMIISELIHALKNKGHTLIISSHIFSTLKETCDQIFLLSNGKLTKQVSQSDFDKLEGEMKQITIGKEIYRILE